MAPILGCLAVFAALVATASAECSSVLHGVDLAGTGEQNVYTGTSNASQVVPADQRCRFKIRCGTGQIRIRLHQFARTSTIEFQNASGYHLESFDGNVSAFSSAEPSMDIVYNPTSPSDGFDGFYECVMFACDGFSLDVPPVDGAVAPIGVAVSTIGLITANPMPLVYCGFPVTCPVGSYLRFADFFVSTGIYVTYESHKGSTTMATPKVGYGLDSYIGQVPSLAVTTDPEMRYNFTSESMAGKLGCVVGNCTNPFNGMTVNATGSLDGSGHSLSGANEFCALQIQCPTGVTAVQLTSHATGSDARVAVCTADIETTCFWANRATPVEYFLLPGNLVLTEEANLDTRFSVAYECIPSLCPAQDAPLSMNHTISEGTTVLPGGLKGTSCSWNVVCPMDKPYAYITTNSTSYKIRSDGSVDTWDMGSPVYMGMPARMWTPKSQNTVQYTQVSVSCMARKCSIPTASATVATTPSMTGTTIPFPAPPVVGTDCPFAFTCPMNYSASSVLLTFPAAGNWTYGGYGDEVSALAAVNGTLPMATNGAASVVVPNTYVALHFAGKHASTLSVTVECGNGVTTGSFVSVAPTTTTTATTTTTTTGASSVATSGSNTTTTTAATVVVAAVESGASAVAMPLLTVALAMLACL